jgi:glutamine amidotransferase
MKVAIINYGLSNLLSVQRAFEHCGIEVMVTGEPQDILSADKIVLPGVGAFKDGMNGLIQLGLDDVIKTKAKSGTPILGICLGMQMLFEESEENGRYSGLGLIPGSVVKIPGLTMDEEKQNVPHIGWNVLLPGSKKQNFESELLNDISVNEEVYFVHSYEAKPINGEHILADTRYGGRDVCAIVGKDNVMGCQFHPEKSGKTGLNIISNFIHL